MCGIAGIVSLGAAPAWQTYDAMLASSFGTLPAPAGAIDAWADAQAKGVWTGTLPAAQLAAPAAGAAWRGRSRRP